jgi:hypothetical protein
MANTKAGKSAPSRAGWHGAPRKSRKRRLPISSRAGALIDWSPTAVDWAQVETACGATFDSVLRDEITRAVEQYFYDAPFEVAAPPADKFVKSLAEATRLAKDLGKVVHSLGDVRALVSRHWKRYFPSEEEEPAHEALADEGDTALLAHIFDVPCKQGRDYRDFSQVVNTIFSTLDAARREIACNDSASFSENDAWERLVVDLACAFKKTGRSPTASKGVSRQPSPFVRFVRELQETFKDETLRRHSTPAGLSNAISSALRHLKPKRRNTAIPIS